MCYACSARNTNFDITEVLQSEKNKKMEEIEQEQTTDNIYMCVCIHIKYRILKKKSQN